MYNIQPGSVFEDGYGRAVHIVSRSPWDKDLLIGVLRPYTRVQVVLFMEDGRAYANTNPKASLVKMIGESPCLSR